MLASSAEQPLTLGDALHAGSRTLAAHTSNPRLEAELLLTHLLERPRTYLHAHPEQTLAPAARAAYARLLARRAAGEPLPYITGHIEFYGLDFAITPAVLIPRPETELLVETALDWLRTHPDAVAADVGVGSGCIAIALAVHTPRLHLHASDLSAVALEVARANAVRHGVIARITFHQGDLLAPLPQSLDLIVSNPPYVAVPEWDALPRSVRQEPPLALLAGDDGLNVIRRLLPQARQALRPGGLLLVEIGEQQAKAAQALAQAAFRKAAIAVLPDLAGKPRLLMVQSRGPHDESRQQ